jgi:hypothetical protein
MENPGEPSAEDRDEWTDRLVRPYVDYPGDNTNTSADEAGPSGRPGPAAPVAPETAPLPAAMAGMRPSAGGTAGRHRGPAASRLTIAIGAAIVIVALAGGLLVLMLPDHSTTALASKCQSSSCQRIAPRTSGAVLPVAASSASASGAYPTSSAASSSARRAATSAATTRRAAAPTLTPTTVIATVKAAASLTAAPSASATTSPAASPTAPAPGLTPGSRISIRATTACCTSFYIGHDDRDNRVMITRITAGSSTRARADATWIVRAGLADSSCVSFESANDPGQYLRYANFELYLDRGERGPRFARDATFCPRPGNSGQGYSFQSANYPDEYIRHYDYIVYIASDGGRNPWDATALWPDDTTWLVSQPWG